MARWWIIAVVIPVWWWLMMAVHELGHVLGCVVSGATIEAVILWPWTISQTIRSDSPAPLIDTWAGPLLGMVMPMVLWQGCRRWSKLNAWVGGWAGFCLIANGVYLGAGWLESAGDAADLINLGVPMWFLLLLGVMACGLGLWQWHRLLEE